MSRGAEMDIPMDGKIVDHPRTLLYICIKTIENSGPCGLPVSGGFCSQKDEELIPILGTKPEETTEALLSFH